MKLSMTIFCMVILWFAKDIINVFFDLFKDDYADFGFWLGGIIIASVVFFTAWLLICQEEETKP